MNALSLVLHKSKVQSVICNFVIVHDAVNHFFMLRLTIGASLKFHEIANHKS